MNKTKEDYSKYFVPVKEEVVKDWRPTPKSFNARLFEAFVESSHQMVEVKVEELPESEHKKDLVKSTKKDRFASSFYSWKKRKDTQQLLHRLNIDVLLIRRGERVALKKKKMVR